jgi:hypothetical protein
MLDTDSALFGIIVTPVLAAVFAFHYYRPMLETDSAFLGSIVTPVLAAVFAIAFH